MIVNEYWLEFMPMDGTLIFCMRIAYFLIGIFGFLLNMFIIVYFIKYAKIICIINNWNIVFLHLISI